MNHATWKTVTIEQDNVIGKIEQDHLVPVGDYRDHDYSDECWCKPREITHGFFSHNSLDRREEYEYGRRLN